MEVDEGREIKQVELAAGGGTFSGVQRVGCNSRLNSAKISGSQRGSLS